jgi:hypothetical protein
MKEMMKWTLMILERSDVKYFVIFYIKKIEKSLFFVPSYLFSYVVVRDISCWCDCTHFNQPLPERLRKSVIKIDTCCVLVIIVSINSIQTALACCK